MAIAAAPNYLQSDDPEFYLSAPPGHRFLLYFAAWGENQETRRVDWRTKDRVPKVDRRTLRQKVDRLGNPEWDDVENRQFACMISACQQPQYDTERPRSRKPKTDKGLRPWCPMLDAILARQKAFSDACSADAMFIMDATSIAPFSTGLGNEHPLENGFAFLNPYGLPYLPGSGVKGVLRQAARELASGEWGGKQGWDTEKRYPLEIERGKPPIKLSMLDVLFGYETKDSEKEHVRGVLSFWDVIPQIHGDHLAVDIMTPHQSHYYQNKPAAGSNTPHESGQPNPICFLTVPPKSGFVFHVQCNKARLKHLAENLVESNQWEKLLEAAFKHAFAWLGFGAKTSVGYGAMQGNRIIPVPPPEPPDTSPVGKFVADCKKKQESQNKDPFNPGQGLYGQALALSRQALSDEGGWTNDGRLKLAEALSEWLPKVIERLCTPDNWKEARKKLKLADLSKAT
jgi:CRISPR-associated protein Cmr6